MGGIRGSFRKKRPSCASNFRCAASTTRVRQSNMASGVEVSNSISLRECPGRLLLIEIGSKDIIQCIGSSGCCVEIYTELLPDRGRARRWRRYRRHSRRGSVARRKSHSSPLRCIQRGAWGLTPAWKSKAAPTPISTGPREAGTRTRPSSAPAWGTQPDPDDVRAGGLDRRDDGRRARPATAAGRAGCSVPATIRPGNRSPSRRARALGHAVAAAVEEVLEAVRLGAAA